jgi:hypothetical protein
MRHVSAHTKKDKILASLGLWWWQHVIIIRLRDQGITMEIAGFRKTMLTLRIYLCTDVIAFHLICAEDGF